MTAVTICWNKEARNSYSIRCYGTQQTTGGHFPPPGMCEGNKPKLSVTVSGSCWPLIN